MIVSNNCLGERIRNYKPLQYALLMSLGVVSTSSAHPANGAPFCAIEVTVRTVSGKPFPNLPAALITLSKTTFANATTNTDGVARFCDAPLQPVGIVVGLDICGSVWVRHLAPTWPDTRHVCVTYAEQPCPHFVFPTSCRILIRVQDEEGRPIAGARFDGRPRLPTQEQTSGLSQ